MLATAALWLCALAAAGCAPDQPDVTDAAVGDLPAPDLIAPVDGLGWRVIAEDTFQRPDQASWGIASDGQPWGSDAAGGTFCAIAANRGELHNADAQPHAATGVLGPVAADVDVLVSGELGPGGDIGGVVRLQDSKNLYKILIDGKNLIIEVHASGQIFVLAAQAFTAMSGLGYHLRCQAMGASLAAKAWATGDPEPADWQVTVSDPTYATGRVGVRSMIVAGGKNFISSFVARQLE